MVKVKDVNDVLVGSGRLPVLEHSENHDKGSSTIQITKSTVLQVSFDTTVLITHRSHASRITTTSCLSDPRSDEGLLLDVADACTMFYGMFSYYRQPSADESRLNLGEVLGIFLTGR